MVVVSNKLLYIRAEQQDTYPDKVNMLYRDTFST